MGTWKGKNSDLWLVLSKFHKILPSMQMGCVCRESIEITQSSQDSISVKKGCCFLAGLVLLTFPIIARHQDIKLLCVMLYSSQGTCIHVRCK